MNCTIRSKDGVRADMIEEALALLHIIDAEQGVDDFNECPDARGTRSMLPALARQLVAKMIEEMQAPVGKATTTPFRGASA
jgi:hypothetical protein